MSAGPLQEADDLREALAEMVARTRDLAHRWARGENLTATMQDLSDCAELAAQAYLEDAAPDDGSYGEYQHRAAQVRAGW